jgi:orotate phosphoribosyltransferase
MTDTSILATLERMGVILTNSHVVYTSGRHGSSYIDLDVLYPDVATISQVCAHIARSFANAKIQIVAGPTIHGVILSQWVAHHLSEFNQRPVLSVYAEEQGVIGQRVFRHGFAGLLTNKRVLVVEDILRTGGTARKMVTAVQGAGGTIAGVGGICNRGNVTAASLNVQRLHMLVDVTMETWNADECPLCQAGIPIQLNKYVEGSPAPVNVGPEPTRNPE